MENANQQNGADYTGYADKPASRQGETTGTQTAHAEAVARELLGIHDAQLRELACCLHDDIGQLLAALSMHLHLAKDSNVARPDLTPCLSIIQQAIQRVREMSSHVYPTILEDLTLPDALRCLLDARSCSEGAEIDLVTSTAWNPQPATVEITAFRAVMEAVENATSRAAAGRIRIELRQDAEALHLAILDDGRNTQVPPLQKSVGTEHGGGWAEISRRIELLGGQWRIESRPGQGSSVHVRLPVAQDTSY
jgi:signal transduction histidine kinase